MNLKSRKFWLAVLGSGLLAAATQAGLDPDLAGKLVTILLAAFIGAEGAADFVRAAKQSHETKATNPTAK